MSRRRISIVKDETLSQETPEVQEKILAELTENGKNDEIKTEELTENNQDNEVKPVKQKDNKKDKILDKEQKENKEEPRDTIFNAGDIVKMKTDLKFDIMGRRIHNGLKNYTYRVLSVRVDGMLIIECLTHCFTVRPEDVVKV